MPEFTPPPSLVERAACIVEEKTPIGTVCWIPDRHLIRVVEYHNGNGKIRAGFKSNVDNEFDPEQLFSEPLGPVENLDYYFWHVTFFRMGRIVSISGEEWLPFMDRHGVVVQYESLNRYAVQIGTRVYHAVLNSKVYGFRRMTLRKSGTVEDLPKAFPNVFVEQNSRRNKVDVVYVPARFDYRIYLREITVR